MMVWSSSRSQASRPGTGGVVVARRCSVACGVELAEGDPGGGDPSWHAVRRAQIGVIGVADSSRGNLTGMVADVTGESWR